MRPEVPVVVAAVLWGLYWVPLRWLEALGVPDTAAGLLMHAVAAGLALPLLWRGRRHLADDRAGYAAVGLLIGLAFGGYSAAVVLTSIVNAVLLFYLTPIWIMAIELVFLRARLSALRLLTVALGLAGLTIVLGRQGAWLPLPGNAGDWLGLLAGIGWGVAAVVLHHRPRPLHVPTTTAASLLGAGLVAAAVHVVLAPPGAGGPALVGTSPGDIILAVAVCQAVIVPAIFLSIRGTQSLAPVVITLILMLEVVIGVVSAALIAGEALGLRQIAGTALVLAAALAEPLAESLARARADRRTD